MTIEQLVCDLETHMESDYFSLDLDRSFREARAAKLDPARCVPALLRFMEENPDVDYGSPGSIVKYLEEFLGRGYEEELLSSLKRRPTTHTLWMLNRMLNVEARASIQNQAVETIAGIMDDAGLNDNIRELAREFYGIQR